MCRLLPCAQLFKSSFRNIENLGTFDLFETMRNWNIDRLIELKVFADLNAYICIYNAVWIDYHLSYKINTCVKLELF